MFIQCEEVFNSREYDFMLTDNSILRVDVLPVGATFQYFWYDCDVWLGVDGVLYGVVK